MSEHQNITAVIYDKRGMVLGVGKNSYVKTHTYMAKIAASVGLPEKQYLHAEMDAILRCKNTKKAHRIAVFRVMKDGTFGNAKPCPVCTKAISLAGIKIIEHT